MLTLAVDTAAEFGSIALVDSSGVIEEVPLHAPQGFSGILFAQVATLLRRNDRQLDEIELFSAASGPGSFTGVRIGLAAVKGLAHTMGRPAAAVSNLEAVASFGSEGMRAPVIDARRGEVYAALFDSANRAVIPECVLPFRKFLAIAEGHRFEWVSAEVDLLRASVAGTPFETFSAAIAPRALAGAIGRISLTREPQDPAVLEANYVRRSDAELLFRA